MTNKTEALKLALEAFEADASNENFLVLKHCVREALADSALDRMVENARELGLDYEPPCKTGSQCTSKCQQCEQPEQQQEPNENAALLAANRDLQVHFDVLMADYKKLSELCTNQGIRLMEVEDDFAGHEHPVQQQEPFCYHDGRNIVGKEFAGDSDVFPLYTSPPASKPWVGLTSEERKRAIQFNNAHEALAVVIESKLKEKNA